MAEITVKTKLPLTSGKEAMLTLDQAGEVKIEMPVSLRTPRVALADLQAAVGELEVAGTFDQLARNLPRDSDQILGPPFPLFTWHPDGKLVITFPDGKSFERLYVIDGPQPMHGKQALRDIARLVEQGKDGRARKQMIAVLDDLIPEAGQHGRKVLLTEADEG